MRKVMTKGVKRSWVTNRLNHEPDNTTFRYLKFQVQGRATGLLLERSVFVSSDAFVVRVTHGGLCWLFSKVRLSWTQLGRVDLSRIRSQGIERVWNRLRIK